jgi:hypothetical protein
MATATWGTIAGMLSRSAHSQGVALSRVSLDAAVVALALNSCFPSLLFLHRAAEIRGDRSTAPADGIVRKMLRYGWWLYLSNLLQQVEMRLNVFLLAALGDLYQTGLYTAVMGPANMLSLLSSPLGLVLLPRTARRSEDSAFPHRVAGALRLIVISPPCRRLRSRSSRLLIPWVFGRIRPRSRPFWILLPGAVGFALVA